MSRSLLSYKALTVSLNNAQGRFNAVEDVSFDLHAGETYCLVGESGSGKTVTAHSALRLIDDARFGDESQICYEKTDIINLSQIQLRQIRGKRIAIIFQEPMTSLNPVLTIGQQIQEVLRVHTHHSHKTAQLKVVTLLDQVGIPDAQAKYHVYPHQLSGGMKQRVMIAMALATEPDILIADEPTTALDVTTQAQVLKIIRDLQQSKSMSILLITHDMAIVKQMADTVGVMYAGQLVEQSPSEAFFKHPRHPYSQMLMRCLPSIDVRDSALQVIPGSLPDIHDMPKGCHFAARCPHRFDACEASMPALYPDGQAEVRCFLYDETGKGRSRNLPMLEHRAIARAETAQREALLAVKDLKIHYPIRKGLFKRVVGHVPAVDGVSFELNAGETLAIVGESGSGKTSLAHGLMHLTEHVTGQVTFDGKTIDARHVTSIRQNVQMVFQDPFSSLNPRMMVRDILSEGLNAQGLLTDKTAREGRLHELLALVALPETALSRYPHEFSGGQRQRLSIARALAVNPKLLICDEPTSALDVSVQAQIINLLAELQKTLGIAYLFISHNIAVVGYLADNVAVMFQGKIVEYGRTEDILRDPQHPYTQQLLQAVPTL